MSSNMDEVWGTDGIHSLNKTILRASVNVMFLLYFVIVIVLLLFLLFQRVEAFWIGELKPSGDAHNNQ